MWIARSLGSECNLFLVSDSGEHTYVKFRSVHTHNYASGGAKLKLLVCQ